MRTVEANGLRFTCVESGPPDGPLALLLHGFPDTPHGWTPVVQALAEDGFHVVAPFMRGYAPTEVPRAAVTLDDLSGDALALIASLGHDRARVLVGHDWGAATAYLAASVEPGRIERLVAIGVPHPATLKPTARLLWAGRHFFTLRLPGAAARMRRRGFALVDTYYRRWSPTWDFGSEETAPVKEVFADPRSLDCAIGYYRASRLGTPPAGFRGRKITVPTLAIAGADDPSIAPAAYEAAQRKFMGTYRVHSLPGGHFVHRESPDAFIDTVRRFLSEP